MFILLILLTIVNELIFTLDASSEDIFVDRIDFTCHRALISRYIVCIDKQTISGNLHTLINSNNISNQNKILVNFNRRAISPSSDFFLGISNRVESDELPFLLIIIDWSHKGTHEDCHKNRKSFNPRLLPLTIISNSNLKANWDQGSN